MALRKAASSTDADVGGRSLSTECLALELKTQESSRERPRRSDRGTRLKLALLRLAVFMVCTKPDDAVEHRFRCKPWCGPVSDASSDISARNDVSRQDGAGSSTALTQSLVGSLEDVLRSWHTSCSMPHASVDIDVRSLRCSRIPELISWCTPCVGFFSLGSSANGWRA